MVVFISHEKHTLPQQCRLEDIPSSVHILLALPLKQIFKLSLLKHELQGCRPKPYLSNMMVNSTVTQLLGVLIGLVHWSEPLETVALLCILANWPAILRALQCCVVEVTFKTQKRCCLEFY